MVQTMLNNKVQFCRHISEDIALLFVKKKFDSLDEEDGLSRNYG